MDQLAPLVDFLNILKAGGEVVLVREDDGEALHMDAPGPVSGQVKTTETFPVELNLGAVVLARNGDALWENGDR